LPRDAEQFRFGFFGLAQSKFRRDGEIGVQFGIVAVNAREKMLISSTGESFRERNSCASSSDGEKGEVSLRHEARNLTQARRCECERCRQNIFPDGVTFPRAKVGDDEGDAELVFRADRAEVDAPVFQSDAAAATVVIDLRDLVLQDAIWSRRS